ncbi:methyl-accepting chemotaxis protein [Sphingomonas floccifaciens]|uniref:Methyl-accepting chemotaxis protein n=1 Tax=Sphingomonas floccifaciens TaxID=1844115 RepID=A0ABW4NDY9_9SPHN
MAASVASESEAASCAIRAFTDQAQQVASLAELLDAAAVKLECEVREHNAVLMTARAALSEQRPVVDALERSPEGLAIISRTVQEIARQSKMLSINARVEAARSGPEARGFAAVAFEMSELAKRTQVAKGDIGSSAEEIARDVHAVQVLVHSQDGLVTSQADLLGSALDHAKHQRDTASSLAMLASEGAERVSAAANSIGRVGATAVAVKMLAREIAKRA